MTNDAVYATVTNRRQTLSNALQRRLLEELLTNKLAKLKNLKETIKDRGP